MISTPTPTLPTFYYWCRFLPALTATLLFLFLFPPANIPGQTGPGPEVAGNVTQISEKEKREKEWADLSDEEKTKLRQALRTVWSDPRVVSARENVNRSALEYREAVRQTLATLDPQSARLVESLGEQTKGPPSLLSNGGIKGKRSGPQTRDLEHFLNPPPFLEKLTGEQKLLYLKASVAAHTKPEVQSALAELKALNREDEELRHRKFEALRKYRALYIEAIVKAEPELVEVISLFEKEREKLRSSFKGGNSPH